MTPDGPPREVTPTRARRSPEGRVALYFPEGTYLYPSPQWVLVIIEGSLYLELLTDEDVADWHEVPLNVGGER